MRLSDRVPCDNHLLIYQMTVLSSIVTHPPTHSMHVGVPVCHPLFFCYFQALKMGELCHFLEKRCLKVFCS